MDYDAAGYFYDYLRKGKLINAIKVYREVTGAPLREAKATVEAMAREMR
jgi:ribosomal protein L7/L12